MPNSTPKVEYSTSFPLCWIDGSSPKRTPEKQHHQWQPQQEQPQQEQPEQERSPPFDRQSQDEVKTVIAADNITQALESSSITVRDFAYLDPRGPENSYPPSAKSHNQKNQSPAERPLDIPKTRFRATPSKRKPLDGPKYSAVYPSAWTLASNPPTPKPADSQPREITSPVIPSEWHSSVRMHRERLQSDSSQGEAIPLSPLRRRLQKEFWSLSIPKEKPHKTARSVSLIDGSELRDADIDLELMRYGNQPKYYAQTVPISTFAGGMESIESRGSQASNYSTLNAAPHPFSRSSHADSPARARNISMTYSSYGD